MVKKPLKSPETGRNVKHWILESNLNNVLYSPAILTTKHLSGAMLAQTITVGYIHSWSNYVMNTLTGTEKYISVKKLASLKH
jgi:hypothetical protein